MKELLIEVAIDLMFLVFTIITAKNLIDYIILKYSDRIWKDYSKSSLLSKSLLYYILEFTVSLWVFITFTSTIIGDKI